MCNPAWRFQGNERKYLEEVLSSGFHAGADNAFSIRLESSFSQNMMSHMPSNLIQELQLYMPFCLL